MTPYARAVFAAILVLLASSLARAQEPRFQLAAKVGATIENSEDNLKGTVPAIGLTVARAFTPRWRGEVEFWLPGYLKDASGEPTHRDVLLSFSAVRLFREAGVRPFLVGGLSLARTEDRLTHCFADRVSPISGRVERELVSCDKPDVIEVQRVWNAGTGVAVLLGGGMEIPLGRRVHIVADVRLLLAPVSVLVRPAVGIAIGF